MRFSNWAEHSSDSLNARQFQNCATDKCDVWTNLFCFEVLSLNRQELIRVVFYIFCFCSLFKQLPIAIFPVACSSGKSSLSEIGS